MRYEHQFTAFVGTKRLASGALRVVLEEILSEPGHESLLVFDDHDGRVIDFDLRGDIASVLARLEDHPLFGPKTQRGPGRPKLGVVGREVSLLPRHWDWLEAQPRSMSATLRQLIDAARKREIEQAMNQHGINAANAFLAAIAGDLEHYEEATRALYAGDREGLESQMVSWPQDIQEYVLELLGSCSKRARGRV